ncbi:hypothetical protein F511_12817 [Dorcoceras hygrometricum]|uniref:Uncharacterized protein n=1 Tax=Dorcoceras hygrometricum TaxID=472368 RepID=A0A2Z7BID1_9LAMI|nr:hypothetical protein F511_12817 [Dorcoceras hygrometricum]
MKSGKEDGASMVRSNSHEDRREGLRSSSIIISRNGHGIFAPVEIREINWAKHFLPKIDPVAKAKVVMDAFARSNPVEEHCMLVPNQRRKMYPTKCVNMTSGYTSALRNLSRRRCCVRPGALIHRLDTQPISRWKSSIRDLQMRQSVDHHSSLVFRRDTQPATTSMIELNLSGATTQPVDHNASSIRESIKFRLNIYLNSTEHYHSSKSKLRSVRNHLLKAAQERKNHWSTIEKISNSATTSCTLNSSTQVSKLVSIERSKEDELSAIDLAPNGGVNQRQSQEIGFE